MDTVAKQDNQEDSIAGGVTIVELLEYGQMKINKNDPQALLSFGNTDENISCSSSNSMPPVCVTQDEEREGGDFPFPLALHKVVSNPKLSDVITWLPNGQAWKILNRKELDEKVIPRHFKQCQYASFMRQVISWGFKRIEHGPDTNAYYHKMFLRGMPELCDNIRRPSKRSTLNSYASSFSQTSQICSLGNVNFPNKSKAYTQPLAKNTKPTQRTMKRKQRQTISMLPQKRKVAINAAMSRQSTSLNTASMFQQEYVQNNSLLNVFRSQVYAADPSHHQVNISLHAPPAADLLTSQPIVPSLGIFQLTEVGTLSTPNSFPSRVVYDTSPKLMQGTTVVQSNTANQALLLTQLTGTSSILPTVQQQFDPIFMANNVYTDMTALPHIVTGQTSAPNTVQQQSCASRRLLHPSITGAASRK